MNARDLAVWLFARVGMAAFLRKILVRDGRFALNLHGVSSRRYKTVPQNLQPHHSVGEFRQVLTWLSARYNFLSVDDFLFTDFPGVLLTFDDGHANNFTNVLPVLAEFGAQGLFFVSTQHVRSPRNWLTFVCEQARLGWESEMAVPEDFARDCYDGLSDEQLVELAGSPYGVIGSHTVHHPSLSGCSDIELQAELIESRHYLQQLTGQDVNCFAYPYGDYNLDVARSVKHAGYKAAFAVDPVLVGMPAFEIPRVDLYYASPDYLSAKLSGLHRGAIRGAIVDRGER
ncbi:MAG: polysaccharide deacetylase family protein [Anaerolineales bacterium]|nr:polysaccharide deacetylase family protein [Anaerolineales bacterium]